MAALMCLGAGTMMAQNNDRGPGGPGGPGRNRGNFDPAQFRQQMMEHYKEVLEVKEDADWKAMQPLVEKVMDARRETFSTMGRGMFGGGFGSRRGGDRSSDRSGDNNSGDRGSRGGFFGAPSPEADALQKAIESKASKAEIKAALAKYVAAREAKQSELKKAQENLRKVLTSRQEAIATINGLL